MDYNNCFERHKTAFQSELLAIKQAISFDKKGIEIGVITGRFAQALTIKTGVELSDIYKKNFRC